MSERERKDREREAERVFLFNETMHFVQYRAWLESYGLELCV